MADHLTSMGAVAIVDYGNQNWEFAYKTLLKRALGWSPVFFIDAYFHKNSPFYLPCGDLIKACLSLLREFCGKLQKGSFYFPIVDRPTILKCTHDLFCSLN